MVTNEWFTVKNGKLQRIKAVTSMEKLNSLLDRGYSVSHQYSENGVTKIKTYSPKTREEAYAEHKKLNRIGRF
jgi:hypothetical protein